MYIERQRAKNLAPVPLAGKAPWRSGAERHPDPAPCESTPLPSVPVVLRRDLNGLWSGHTGRCSSAMPRLRPEGGPDAKVLGSSIVGILRHLTKVDKAVDEIEQAVSLPVDALSLRKWIDHAQRVFPNHPLRHHFSLSLAIAFLRDPARQGIELSAAELEYVWSLVRTVLLQTTIVDRVSRSAQGFFVVPLWSAVEDGNVVESLRLEVLLPNGERPEAILANRSFAQSWVLCGGEATEDRYQLVSPDTGSSDTRELDEDSQKSFKFTGWGTLARATDNHSELLDSNSTYTTGAGVPHIRRAAPDGMLAMLTLLDSSRGYQQAAQAPDGAEQLQKQPDAGATTSGMLAVAVQAFREWERAFLKGWFHACEAELEEALLAFQNALSICDEHPDFPRPSRYRWDVLVEIGYAHRKIGRLSEARRCFQEALKQDGPLGQRLALALIQNQQTDKGGYRRALQEQYEAARSAGSKDEMGRAVGNLGIENHRLFLVDQKPETLALAMRQQRECIELCRQVREEIADGSSMAARTNTGREFTAYAYLSLGHAARGEAQEAVLTASQSQRLAFDSGDKSKLAFSRLVYGRALLLVGRRDEALQQFNPADGYSPLAALAKAPLKQHVQYMGEMIEAGADVMLRDPNGYSALDHAVYSGYGEHRKLLERAIRRQFGAAELEAQLSEAILRRDYREMFQVILRPVLLQPDGHPSIRRLRDVYAQMLAGDGDKAARFDRMKYVRFDDFAWNGRLPKSTDGLTRHYERSEKDNFIIFISYTWTKRQPGEELVSPDDAENTKYGGILNAVEDWIELHPDTERSKICIWLDWACIDQVDTDEQARGVAALPMCITQCDAMISMVDDSYYERAWCCVEVLAMQRLQKSYGTHQWWEYVYDHEQGKKALRRGRVGREPDIAAAKVTFDSDRPKLAFLERQVKLLDRTMGDE
ncbi:hypothetical protein MAPG_09815 [Magnaporthiopsis poae ATCC 64411]|uniref:Uncharacterized protein n=1 Tax=Magnaporthiopsis poae (strain ATCC 64411 / 73-15) TaxID=644358 RepID=A0A0C4EAX8_MAGP6|nr:hypothetical protein MAPG_09815 [Magnaporthiopsis poae ATCC 64411]